MLPPYRHDSGRRRFLTMVGLAGVASAFGMNQGARAQSSPAPPAPPAQPTPPPAPPGPPEISEDARALAGIVERRYGVHLAEGDLAKVTEGIEFRLRGGKRLREAKLVNADEPDAVFRA
jgi:hypothetical protein